jgi:hypothetical protein
VQVRGNYPGFVNTTQPACSHASFQVCRANHGGQCSSGHRKQQDTSANLRLESLDQRPSVACIICLCLRTQRADRKSILRHFLFEPEVALYSPPRQLLPKMLKCVVSTTTPSASLSPLQFLSSLAPNPLPLGSKLPLLLCLPKCHITLIVALDLLHQTAHHHVLDYSLPTTRRIFS